MPSVIQSISIHSLKFVLGTSLELVERCRRIIGFLLQGPAHRKPGTSVCAEFQWQQDNDHRRCGAILTNDEELGEICQASTTTARCLTNGHSCMTISVTTTACQTSMLRLDALNWSSCRVHRQEACACRKLPEAFAGMMAFAFLSSPILPGAITGSMSCCLIKIWLVSVMRCWRPPIASHHDAPRMDADA